jgi:hypothetical protein
MVKRASPIWNCDVDGDGVVEIDAVRVCIAGHGWAESC